MAIQFEREQQHAELDEEDVEDVEEHARASWWFCGICPGRKLDDHHDRPIFCFVSTRMVGGWMDGVGEEKRREGTEEEVGLWDTHSRSVHVAQ